MELEYVPWLVHFKSKMSFKFKQGKFGLGQLKTYFMDALTKAAGWATECIEWWYAMSDKSIY